MNVGDKVKITGQRDYVSNNEYNDEGKIIEIDNKYRKCVRVEVPGRKKTSNWENIKFLTKI